MLSNAVRICAASYGALWIREGRTFRNVAFHGALSKEFTDKWRQTVIPPGSSLPLARVIETQKPVHIADMRDHRSYLDGQPLAVTGVDIGGIRTMLLVPMLKEKELVGAVAIYRKEVRSFSDKRSSRSRTRACSASCASHWSIRRRQARCLASSPDPQPTFSQYST
jgi:transcriptional regulator with GAF, ATPase, and Fis domain